ncbi:MAG TPA: hypothetical protein VLH08_11955 [Acidobacteriota bacterium]|nr:hypothetical protein [Acidobacteriota bacterium]
MALETLSRWEMIRELSYFKKSGTLTAQLGRSYLHWTINQGDLICFSSTSADYSFTRFLYEKNSIDAEKLTWAQSFINESRTLGLAIVQKKLLEPDSLRNLLKEHCYENAHFLIHSGTHLFFSPRLTQLKQHMIQIELPLSEILLQSDRNSLEIRSAVAFGEYVLGKYRVREFEVVEAALRPQEKRMISYLKSSASLPEILSDPELDRLTCYRVLFLLWISGYIQEIKPRAVEDGANSSASDILNKLRVIPLEWIIPLTLGIILGVIFAPTPTPPPPKPCNQVLNPPPWSQPQ